MSKKQTPAQIAEALGKYISKQETTLKRYPVGPLANAARKNLAKGQAALQALKGKSEQMRTRMQSQLKGKQAPMQMTGGGDTPDEAGTSTYDAATDLIRQQLIAEGDGISQGRGAHFAALYDIHIANGASPKVALAMTSVAKKESDGNAAAIESGNYRYSSAKNNFANFNGVSEDDFNKLKYQADENGNITYLKDAQGKIRKDQYGNKMVDTNVNPVLSKEVRDANIFNKAYDKGKKGKELGNTATGDGYKYRGRGQFQLTGRANYAALGKWAKEKGYVDDADYYLKNPDEVATLAKAGQVGEFWFYGKDKFKDSMGFDIGTEDPSNEQLALAMDQTYARVRGATGQASTNATRTLYAGGIKKMRTFTGDIIEDVDGEAPTYDYYDTYLQDNYHETVIKDGKEKIKIKGFKPSDYDKMAANVLGLPEDTKLTDAQRREAQKQLNLTGGAVDGEFGNNFLSAYALRQAEDARKAAERDVETIDPIAPKPAGPIPSKTDRSIRELDALAPLQIPTDTPPAVLEEGPYQEQLAQAQDERAAALQAKIISDRERQRALEESRDLVQQDLVAQPDATAVAGLGVGIPDLNPAVPADPTVTTLEDQLAQRQANLESLPLLPVRGQTLPTVTVTAGVNPLAPRTVSQVPNELPERNVYQNADSLPGGFLDQFSMQESNLEAGRNSMLQQMRDSDEYSRRDVRKIKKDPDLLQRMYMQFLGEDGDPMNQLLPPNPLNRLGGTPKMTWGGDVGDPLGNVQLTPEQRGGVLDPNTNTYSYPSGSIVHEASRVKQLKEAGEWEQPKPTSYDYSLVEQNDFVQPRMDFNRYFDLTSFSDNELLYDTIGRPYVARDSRTNELVHFTKDMYAKTVTGNKRQQDVIDNAFGRSGTMIQTGNKNMSESTYPNVQSTGQYLHDISNYQLTTSSDPDVPPVQVDTPVYTDSSASEVANRAPGQPLARGVLKVAQEDRAVPNGLSFKGEELYDIHGVLQGVNRGAGVLEKPDGTTQQLFVPRSAGDEGRNSAPVFYNKDGQIIGRYLGGGNFGVTQGNTEVTAASSLERWKRGNTEGNRRNALRDADSSINPYQGGVSEPTSGTGATVPEQRSAEDEAAAAGQNSETDLTQLPTVPPKTFNLKPGAVSAVQGIPALAALASVPIQREALNNMQAPQNPTTMNIPAFNYRSNISQQLQDARSGVNALSRNNNLDSSTAAANRQGLLAQRFRQENRLYNQDSAEYQRQRNAYDLRSLQADQYNTQLRNKYLEDLRTFNNTSTILDAQIKQQPLNILSASASDYLKNIYGPNQQVALAGLGRNFDTGLLEQG